MTIKNISSSVNLNGSTMIGELVLNADPSTNYQAATKHYVDTASGSSIQEATQADQIAGSSTTKYVSPNIQKQHLSALKAWIKFDSTSGGFTFISSWNVVSITANSVRMFVSLVNNFSAINGYNTATAILQIESQNAGGAVTAHVLTAISDVTQIRINTFSTSSWVIYPLRMSCIVWGRLA